MIDVSAYQGIIDWRKVHQAGVRTAYVKRTELDAYNGNGIDPQSARNILRARAEGVQVGVYHFAHPSNSPSVEARFFLRASNGLIQPGDPPPALDLEVTEGHSWEYLNAWKAEWFKAVDQAVGVRAVFYSYLSFWEQMRLYPDRPVWGADLREGFVPPAAWCFHQYSFTGHVDGITGQVDLDRILRAPANVTKEV